MKKIIIGFLSFYATIIFSQSDNIDWLVPPQGFGIGLLNSCGNSSIINDVSNEGLMNPAAISNFENYTMGFSYQYNSNIEKGWINDSEVKRQNDFIPQSAGGIFRWNELTLGIGYQHKYNIDVDLRGYSNGFNEVYNTHFKGRVHSYSFALAYSLNKIMNENSYVDIGLNYTFNNVDFSSTYQNQETLLNDNSGNFSFGIQYTNKNSDDTKTKIGLSYTLATDFESEYYYSNFTVIIRTTDAPNAATADNLITGHIPDKFSLDFSKDLSNAVTLNASAAGIFWHRDNNILKDQIEFSASTIYKINEMFSPAFGFYYTDNKYENGFFDFNNKFNSIFLIAGLNINYNIFSADLAIADSHLFSGDFRKQTIGKLSIGVSL